MGTNFSFFQHSSRKSCTKKKKKFQSGKISVPVVLSCNAYFTAIFTLNIRQNGLFEVNKCVQVFFNSLLGFSALFESHYETVNEKTSFKVH
jgi:hypothetical protein